jgi:predicted aldo/keto reductase-like oxidoreductase
MQDRRNFLKKSLLALTGAGMAHHAISSRHSGPLSGDRDQHFIYRELGNSGVRVPVISMGTGNCDNPNLVREALDRGVKLLATHEFYLNGNNEKMVGRVLQDRPRDSCMILTGTGEGLDIDFQSGRFGPETNLDVYLEGVHGCLERLQVDHVDILNAPYAGSRDAVFYEPLLKALESLKKLGKVRFLGMASHNLEHEAIRAAADTGVYDMVTIAYNFRKQNIQAMNRAMQYAADKGLGIIGMKTMAGVYWDKQQQRSINTRAALKWVLQNENIHTTIPDCSSFEELQQDLDIMGDMGLTEEEWRDLTPPEGDNSTGLYCQQCQECLAQCPGNIDIPTLMRSYMYAYGYHNMRLACQTIHTARQKPLSCHDCRECRVDCAMGFDVRQKLLDIERIKEIPEDLILFA